MMVSPTPNTIQESTIQLLYVDADESSTAALRRALKDVDPPVTLTHTTTGQQAVATLTDQRVDCIVTEYSLPDQNGVELLETIRETHPTVPVILFTGSGSESVASAAINHGASGYLQKHPESEAQYQQLADQIIQRVAESRARRNELHEPPIGPEPLREVSKTFETMFQNSPDAIFVLDVEDEDTFRIAQINPAEESLLGDLGQSAVGQTPGDLYDDATAEKAVAAYRRCLDAGEPIRSVETFELDGEARTFKTVLAPITVDGTPTQIIGISEELTEILDLEADLGRFKEAVEHAGSAIYITDAAGTIQYVNDGFVETTGYSKDRAIGTTPRILNSTTHTDDYYDELWTTITSGEIWEERIVNKRQNGEIYHAIQTIAPIEGEGSEQSGFVAIQTDITEDLLNQQQISVLNRMLRHNLRNYLNVISGSIEQGLENLQRGNPSNDPLETALEYCDRLLKESEHVRGIQEAFERKEHSTHSIGQVIGKLESRSATDSNVEIEATQAVVDNWEVPTDVEEALLELLDNAIIHAGNGPIQVVFDAGENKKLNISIIDSGPGLPEVEQRVLAGKIEQPLKHSTGIGLWTAYWFIQHAGGTISYKDKSPSGAHIEITLQVV